MVRDGIFLPQRKPKPLTVEQQADHDRSVHDYPSIQFSPTEYVVIDVIRSIWGVVFIWLVSFCAFAAVVGALLIVSQGMSVDANLMMITLVGTTILIALGGWIVTYVYQKNHLIVTNQRIIQQTQFAPFSYRNQNIEIEHVEDASFRQSNLVQILFGYGTVRLSTIGSEHTYTFSFVARPAEQFAVINRVVQAVDEQAPTEYKE
jgi:hypothetical protein